MVCPIVPEISVTICTRKSREDHLNRVLDALKGQTLPIDRWELSRASVEPPVELRPWLAGLLMATRAETVWAENHVTQTAGGVATLNRA